ncbi:MAG: TonB-dependent receptor, partial [Balneolaceae bacterium]|nr:TonB-dependent receptor [Balneolaceae bacterium]
GNFFVGDSFVQSFGPVSNNNPDLKWEENREFNLGLDITAFDNRMQATIEYYERITDDLLFEVEVPVPPNLFPTTWRNVGRMDNTGLDLSLGYDIIRNQNTNWNSLVNFSTFETILVEFVDETRFVANAGSPGQNAVNFVRLREGEELGQLWAPVFAGVDDQGRELVFDAEGNRVTTDQVTQDDGAVVGKGLPDFEIGWTNTLNYKNWDVSIFLRGVFGHDLINTQKVFFEHPSNITNWNVTESALDIKNITSAPSFTSRQVEDADFVRFQNFTVGYTIPLGNEGLLSDVRRVRLYVSGNNLFSITNYTGIDPEVRYEDTGTGAGSLAPGIERRDQWFTARSISVGVNLDF